jgi:two-component system response regulator YesN
MKLFKQKYGTGIFEYLQQLRMDKAKTLLNDPEIKIQYIAEMTGFNDQNYFSKAFRHATGQSPSEYRRRVQKTQV